MSTASEQPLAYGATVTGAERIAARADETLHMHGASTARAVAWPMWTVLTLFWIYVALSNVLYARSMSQSLDPHGVNHYFAAWDVRALQHVFLYPILIGAIWTSLRLRWRPAWRAMPLQLALAIGFAALAAPCMFIAARLTHIFSGGGAPIRHKGLLEEIMFGGVDRHYMIASMTSFFLAYGFALALTTGLALYQRYRDSELRLATLERALSGARLAALRMQLSPHTLFNLLHAIHGQIRWDPVAAQSMVVQFGDLLRRLLAAGERDFCRLRDELQFVRLYLELQHRRFADRLQLTLPDPAQMVPVWVPSLILQPLAENAVVHGLTGHTGAVAIRLDVSVAEEALVLRITNTTGADPARSRDGIGLRNVRERLALHFGPRATLEAGPSAPHEWCTTVHIPLIYDRRYDSGATERPDVASRPRVA